MSDLKRSIDPEYADPVGDGSLLVHDVEDIWERYARITIEVDEISVARGPSELDARVIGVIDADFVGRPTWKVRGTVGLELVRRSDGFRVRSGLLTELRDIERLMRARREALEANDVERIRGLLHPAYQDGDLDRDEVMRRLAGDVEGTKIRIEATNYRVDLRGAKAHVDEHYVLSVNDRPSPPMVGRFTVERSAGRFLISAGLYRDER